MGDLKLVIRGPAAASKMSGLQVQLTFNNSVNGDLTFTLKDVISNNVSNSKPGTEKHVSASAGTANNYSLGDFFDTPKTGAYLVTAKINGQSSNDLAIKLLL